MSKVIVDVREPSEFARGHVDGAINIPPAAMLSGAHQLDNLDKDTEIILYCVSGSRSNVCMNILRSKGFTNLKNGINMHHVSKNISLNNRNSLE
jgi:phage shock protein E